MSWDSFAYFAAIAALMWIAGVAAAFRSRRKTAAALSAIGSAALLAFIILMWAGLGRPPMRTLGETRLWYSLFLSLVGIAIYLRWKYPWTLAFGSGMSLMFMCINLFKPEIHSGALMPALQSPWFVPHVTVYMFAYAMLGAATICAVILWMKYRRDGIPAEEMSRCDVLVRIGWAFLGMGMAMGALWAKQAWGDWWAWDVKETWALATWLGYLCYLHLNRRAQHSRLAFVILCISFLMLQMCWWGVNLLPSTGSLHVY